MTDKKEKQSFVCPHNENVSIINQCPITECPFHVQSVSIFFEIKNPKTNCVYYDSDIMSNVSDNRTQISSLSRDSRRTISPKSVKESYDDALQYIRTKIKLIHDISSVSHSCKNCGYPLKKTTENHYRCMSTSLCKSRQEWVNYVISLYGLDANTSTKQLIWESLFKNEIHLEQRARELGYSLCSSKDMAKIPILEPPKIRDKN